MTHILTQTAKILCGNSGENGAKWYLEPERKGPNSAQKCQMDFRAVDHNPEVAGSSPVSATIKVLKSQDFRTFSLYLTQNMTCRPPGSMPVPSLDPYGKHFRKHQMDYLVYPAGALVFFHHFFRNDESNFRVHFSGVQLFSATRRTPPHGICHFFLGRGCDMGVGIEGESYGEVARHTGYRLAVYSVLQSRYAEES